MSADLDDFFAGVKQRRVIGVLDRWLAADPKRAEKLWAVLDEAEKRGVAMGAVIERWNQIEEPLPVKRCQLHRKWRDRQAGQ
jgi:hypothetical protein